MSSLYPLGLRLAGRRVLVVGGGTVATRRVPALLDAGADVLLVAPSVTPALSALIDAGRVRWAPRKFEPSDVDGAWLVQAALDDRVAADHLIPGLLLDELRPEVELVDASKIPYGPAKAQEEINRILVAGARAGKFVVRLKGGDPYVFGRGGEEVLACAAAGVPVTVVPGVTSAVAVPAAAGIPVTHRGVAHEFVVVSGHVAPDDPRSLADWPLLAGLRGTLCVLMGLNHLPAIADVLIEHGRPPDTPAALIQD